MRWFWQKKPTGRRGLYVGKVLIKSKVFGTEETADVVGEIEVLEQVGGRVLVKWVKCSGSSLLDICDLEELYGRWIHVDNITWIDASDCGVQESMIKGLR